MKRFVMLWIVFLIGGCNSAPPTPPPPEPEPLSEPTPSASPSPTSGVVIETVAVGDPGNPADYTGYGSVAYAYNIGKYEVTAGQYKAFLNAVAATDTYGLYNTAMGDPYTEYVWGCNIQRTGSSGSYTYSVATDWADRPVNYVSWGDAARFANWLHNGQPTGAQGPDTTETGAYALNGATTDDQLLAVNRETDATWVIPTEDEWYKAAYYKGGSTNAGYFALPTSSDTWPGPDMADASGNNANYFNDGSPSPYPLDPPYSTTVAGEFQNSDSPYGTFDQGGNVQEWNETVHYGSSSRGLRGGSFDIDVRGGGCLHASYPSGSYPTSEFRNLGFRVSEVN